MTLEQLDRTIYEALRVETVGQGYLGDWTTVSGATIEDKRTDMKILNDAIKANNRKIIEVMGVGSGSDRGTRKECTITVDRVSISEGSTINTNVIAYEKQEDNTFEKFKYPDSTAIVSYEVRVFCKTTEYERILQTIVTKALGRRRMLKALDSSTRTFIGEDFLLEFNGAVNVTSADYIEWLFKYQAVDVYIEEPEIVDANVPPLTEVRECVYLEEKADNNLIEENIITE